MATVERIMLIGALALLKDVIHERRARSTTDAVFLRELAREKSARSDLSSEEGSQRLVALVEL